MKPILATLIGVVLAAAPLTAQQEEKPKVPKNSVLVDVTGCLKGRVLRAEDVRQPDTTTGLVIRNRAFRLAGKKDPASPAEHSLPGQSLLACAAQRPGDLPGSLRVTRRRGNLTVGCHLAPRDATDYAPDIFKVAHAIQTVAVSCLKLCWVRPGLLHCAPLGLRS